MQRSTFATPGLLGRSSRHALHWALALCGGFGIAMPAAAEAAENGLYWSVELGVALPGELASTRTNIGVPTNCDQWLGAAMLADGSTVPLPAAECQPRPLPASANEFDLSRGHLAGVAIGREFGGLRLEAEYFHQRRGGETLPLLVPGDPKQQEFVERSEEIDAFGGHHWFANVFYDIGKAGGGASRYTPFVGAGIGVMHLSGSYRGLSVRVSDRAALLALGRNPNAAGTTSRAAANVSDTLFGYQLVAGVDTVLRAGRIVTAKVRWGQAFADFDDGGNAWRPLRDHDSTVGPGGAPISYGIVAERPGFWAISVGIKFPLGASARARS